MATITETARRVRVTIDGNATQVGHDPELLRLEREDGGVFLVCITDPGTKVEDLAPVYDWTPGDVVAGDVAYTRQPDGRWHGWLAGCHIEWTDAEVSQLVADDELDVLRYQAGGVR